jgi:mannose/fructose/sorbose-specific phosphotransferase system IIB component
MPILLTRIDDRLIHGQVVVGWAQALKINHIVVVNDDITANDMQKFLFRMATPTDINLSILTIEEAAAKINKREFDEDNTIILVKAPSDIYKMIKAGGKVPEVNIGGMHFDNNKTQLFDAVFVDGNDVSVFRELNAMGVELEVRMVPTDTKKNIIKAIDDKFGKDEEKKAEDTD